MWIPDMKLHVYMWNEIIDDVNVYDNIDMRWWDDVNVDDNIDIR